MGDTRTHETRLPQPTILLKEVIDEMPFSRGWMYRLARENKLPFTVLNIAPPNQRPRYVVVRASYERWLAGETDGAAR